MRNLKRALSLALATVMTMGLMVVGSSASYSDVVATDNVEAIEVAQAVGVMVGDDNGNFNPDQQVTRAEMATVMANLLNLSVDNFKGATLSFTDVPDWAVPYVAACAANGIVSGYSNTTFGSNDTVTAAQAGLMVLKALGYFQNASDFGSDWTLATAKQAGNISLYKGISAGVSTAMTRNDVAQLVLNALKTPMVEVEGNTGTTIEGNGFVISNGATKYTEVTKVYDASVKTYRAINDTVTDGREVVELGEQLFDGDLVRSTNASNGTIDDARRPATKWTYKGTEIGTYADEADAVLVLDGNYTKDDKDLLETLQDLMGNNKLSTTSSTSFALNGVNSNATEIHNASQYGTVIEVYLDSSNNNVVTNVSAYNYTLHQIDDIDTDVKTADANNGVSCYVTFSDVEGQINDTDIPGFNASTYVENAYVAMIVKNATTNPVIIDTAIADTVEGSITTKKQTAPDASKSETFTEFFDLTVSGTKYRTNINYKSGVKTVTNYSEIKVTSDDSYILYLDPNGYVIGMDGVKGTGTVDDVYYVESLWAENGYVTGGSTKDTYYAQLINVADGTVSEVTLESNDKNEYEDNGVLKTYADGSYVGALVTISDKKWEVKNADNTTTTYKSGNGKYDLKLWANGGAAKDDGFSWAKLAGTATGETLSINRTDTRAVLGGNTSYRLTSSTVYVFVEGKGDDVKTSIYTGGASFKKASNGAIVITDKDSTSTALYVMIFADDAGQNAYSDDLIYVKSKTGSKGDGFYAHDVYQVVDGALKKVTLNIDDGEYDSNKELTPGFYTYELNSDGYYKLEEADKLVITGKDDAWDNDEGVLLNALITDDDDLANNLLSVTVGGVEYNDMKVTSSTLFLDARGDSDREAKGQYSSKVGSLSRLATILDNSDKTLSDGTEVHAEATLQVNVSKDGVVSVILTSLKIDVPNATTTTPDTNGTETN
jgi:hypothetical protein